MTPLINCYRWGTPVPQQFINHKFFEMAVAFSKFEKSSTKVENLGTVKAHAGKGGKVAFLRKNFKNKGKRIALIVERKNGTSAVIPLSEQLSQLVRDEEITMKQLVGLQVIEFAHRDKKDKDGKPVIVHTVALPQGGGKQSFDIDDLETEEFELSDDFLPEHLVTFA